METWTSFFAHRTVRRGPHWLTLLLLLLALTAAGMGRAKAAETITYYYTSPQGTVLAKTDAAGNIISNADYRPYGSQALGSPEDGPGFTGHVNDADSGLVYMQARYYDPEVGRFLSTDPAALRAGDLPAFGRFSYADLNPVKMLDPDGKQSWCTPGTCGAESYKQTSDKLTWVRNNFDAVFEAKGALGIGLEVNVNFTQVKGEINFLPIAQGLEMSMALQKKNPIAIPLTANPTDGKMGISWGGGFDIAAGVKIGMDSKLDPGGKVELTPKFGAGVGEFQQFSPSINMYEWKDVDDRSVKQPTE